MTLKQILIEPSGSSNMFRLGLDGEPLPTHPFFTMHLYHLGEVREELRWWTALNPEQLGTVLSSEIEGLNGNVYCVYVSAENCYQLRDAPNLEFLILRQHFQLIDNKVSLISEELATEKRRKMVDNILSPMYASDGHDPSAKPFQIVVFYAGVSIHNPSSTNGITINPIYPGLSNVAVLHTVFDYLNINNPEILLQETELEPYLRHQPLFAITFHQVFSTTAEGALRFIKQIANDISTIIASERGDRPLLVSSILFDLNSGSYNIYPKDFDLRGNLLPPILANTHTSNIEKLFPIIQAQPFARLILELYVQALAERDRSFRIFRQWSLLEMIADKKIKATNYPLKNLDGSPINLSSGKSLDTLRKEGKVYCYLRDGDLAQIHQSTNSGSVKILEGSKGYTSLGGSIERIITLWDAVAASYKMRNAVAHDGKFTPYEEPQDEREILCNEFFFGSFGFLEHALSFAVWREIKGDG